MEKGNGLFAQFDTDDLGILTMLGVVLIFGGTWINVGFGSAIVVTGALLLAICVYLHLNWDSSRCVTEDD